MKKFESLNAAPLVVSGFFLLFAILTLVQPKIRIPALTWVLGKDKIPFEGTPALFVGWALAAWGGALVLLGIHLWKHSGRTLKYLAVVGGIRGLLLVVVGIWRQIRAQPLVKRGHPLYANKP